MIFIVQPDYLAIDSSHTVHLQGPPRAIYSFAPLGLQFLARTLTMTMCMLLYRCDFGVQFESEGPTSVFYLLQEACTQMAWISYNTWQKKTSAAKPPQNHQKFVYSRFMWGECVRQPMTWTCVIMNTKNCSLHAQVYLKTYSTSKQKESFIFTACIQFPSVRT